MKTFHSSENTTRSSRTIARVFRNAGAFLLLSALAACGGGGGGSGGGGSSTAASWTQMIGTLFIDYANSMAVDRSGNIFVAGYTQGSFEGVPPPSGGMGDTDSVVFKYAPSGARLWTRQITGFDHDVATGLATDASGNVFIAGVYDSGSYLIKSDANGNRLWTRFGAGTSVAVDAGGSAYVLDAGTTGSTVARFDGDGNALGTTSVIGEFFTLDANANIYTFGGTALSLGGSTNAGAQDAFVVKYDNGGLQLWTVQFGSALFDQITGLATDANGNIYVAGNTTGSLDGNANAGANDVFVAKYDIAGTRQWIRQFGTIGEDVAAGVAVDARGNVYVTGATQGALDGNLSAGAQDLFLVKYDPAGSKLWTRQAGSTAGDRPCGIAIDPTGNIYIAGKTGGSIDGKPFAGSDDFFIVKYNLDGQKQ